jgi:cobalt-zinc-cadmium efflux system membrane fusion protein
MKHVLSPLLLLLLLLLLLWSLAACSSQPSAPAQAETIVAAPPHVDEPAHEELPKLVRLSAKVIADAQIKTSPVRREVLPSTLALPGELAADPDKSARLSSPIPGRIESVRFQEGDKVKKGALLATIVVPDLGRLRAEQASATARAAAARSNAERLKQLLEQRLTAEQTYRDAVAQAEALELEARAAAQHLQALGLMQARANPSQLSLHAPFAGVVVSRNAVIGQPVVADQILGEIIDLSEVWFLGRVFEKDLERLKLHAPAEVELNAYSRERFEGVVEYIGQRVDPVARTVTARIRLKNRADLLRVGLFGNAYVALDEAAKLEPTLVVARSALTEIGHEQVVFVQHADGDFELHEVVLGRSATGKVEVVSGLREGEQVVDQGVFTLKSAVLKSTFTEDE